MNRKEKEYGLKYVAFVDIVQTANVPLIDCTIDKASGAARTQHGGTCKKMGEYKKDAVALTVYFCLDNTYLLQLKMGLWPLILKLGTLYALRLKM